MLSGLGDGLSAVWTSSCSAVCIGNIGETLFGGHMKIQLLLQSAALIVLVELMLAVVTRIYAENESHSYYLRRSGHGPSHRPRVSNKTDRTLDGSVFHIPNVWYVHCHIMLE